MQSNKKGSCLAIAAVSSIGAPQLWEVLLASLAELAPAPIEVLSLLIGISIRGRLLICLQENHLVLQWSHCRVVHQMLVIQQTAY